MTLPASELEGLVAALRARGTDHGAELAADALEAMGAELAELRAAQNGWLLAIEVLEAENGALRKANLHHLDTISVAARKVDTTEAERDSLLDTLRYLRVNCLIADYKDSLKRVDSALSNKDLSDRQQQGSMK